MVRPNTAFEGIGEQLCFSPPLTLRALGAAQRGRFESKAGVGCAAGIDSAGPLFAAEQSQPRRGDVAEHWASREGVCLLVGNARLMHLQ
jgi:hypothetical protein